MKHDDERRMIVVSTSRFRLVMISHAVAACDVYSEYGIPGYALEKSVLLCCKHRNEAGQGVVV